MRLAVFCFTLVYQYLEIECNPMCFLAIIFSVNIAEAEEFIVENLSAVFLKDFIAQIFFNRYSEFHTAPADIKTALFISAIFAALVHEHISFAIVAKEDDGDSCVVNAFSHSFRSLLIIKSWCFIKCYYLVTYSSDEHFVYF